MRGSKGESIPLPAVENCFVSYFRFLVGRLIFFKSWAGVWVDWNLLRNVSFNGGSVSGVRPELHNLAGEEKKLIIKFLWVKFIWRSKSYTGSFFKTKKDYNFPKTNPQINVYLRRIHITKSLTISQASLFSRKKKFLFKGNNSELFKVASSSRGGGGGGDENLPTNHPTISAAGRFILMFLLHLSHQ